MEFCSHITLKRRRGHAKNSGISAFKTLSSGRRTWTPIMSHKELFESISVEEIADFVSSGQEEHLSLEFKSIRDPNLKRRDDRRNLAVALSGFSNSSGGIIVWGVEARKNDNGVDCAFALCPIEGVSLLLSRLNELTGEATSPVLHKVQHRVIKVEDDKGYAITLVPESDSGPHMAKLGENRYYKRSGDSFYRMEHFDLEDMFGRRKRPKLDLSLRTRGFGKQTEIILGISNHGRGSAFAPYLAFKIPAPFKLSMYGVDGNGSEGLPRLLQQRNGNEWKRYGGNAQVVIHPETILEVALIHLGLGTSNPDPPHEGVVIEYEMTADGIRMVKGERKVSFG